MASAIGTALISTILKPMAVKAMDNIRDKVKAIVRSMAERATEMVVDNIEREISNLQTTFCMIQGIVQVAEEKQINDDLIRNWLHDLVDIGFKARDVLDDFNTFSSCITTAKETSNPVNFIFSLMLSYFGSLSSDTSKLPLAILNRLEKDITSVRKRFEEKKKEGETFGTLKSIVGGGGSKSVKNGRPIVGPSIDVLFLGREDEKEEIMEKILHHSDDNRVQVVAIWGMGGIGKTTLAQSIYNDERVKEDDYPTKNRRWLCVGENKFSAKEIITKIICYSSIDDIERLQKKLVEKLRGNRFLIVLDDVWDVDRNEWKILWDPLTNIRRGGVIILTTRRSEVIIETNTLVPDALRPLSHQNSWSIFESCAFINGKSDTTPDLKHIGKKIVKKLNGLPLAMKVVGCSLLDKDSSTWTNFLDYKDWMLIDDENDNNIMFALRWSYNHLPRHLKMCFTYCSLFPKNHVFYEKVLVEMWMAHDLIQKKEQEQPEDVGAQYFKELVNASLLQCVDGKHVMHDLIHDLALLVSNGEFASANSSLTNDQMEKVRHITITPGDYSKIPRLCKMEKLLTLYTIWSNDEKTNWCTDSVLADLLKQLKSIRMLVFKQYGIPDCISELKHVRYLDVSQTSVKSLPDSICNLYHLQTLAAPLHAILPRKIVNMVNLRHLRANLITYEGIKKLTSLQELSSVSVCEDGCISELGHLRELRGKLKIQGLENVTRPEDAAEASMKDKKDIDELTLVFKVNMENAAIATNVLDALQCPPNLTCLTLDGYSGNKFPNWMTSGNHVVNLQSLGLQNCHQLKFVSPLQGLNSLKHLDLKSMHGLEQLGDELYEEGVNGRNCTVFFPRLESLKVSECPKLVSVLPPSNASNFMRSLHKLEISDCHGLPLFKLDGLMSLKQLVIQNCSNLACIAPSLQVASTIEEISISICEKLKRIDCESLPSLTHLSIIRCDEIVSIPHLVRIERLDLNDCGKLRSLTIGRQGLKSLNDLHIEECPLLKSIYEEGSTSSSSSSSSALPLRNLQSIITDSMLIFTKLFNHELASITSILIRGFNGVERFGDIVQNKWHNLDSLVNLFIFNCKDLKSLSPEFHDLPSLKVLHIYCCPKLESLPAGGLPDFLESLKVGGCPLFFERCKYENGLDWEKIKHISDREILLYDSDSDSDDHIDDHCTDDQIDDDSDEDQRQRGTANSRQDMTSSFHLPRRLQRSFVSSSPRLQQGHQQLNDRSTPDSIVKRSKIIRLSVKNKLKRMFPLNKLKRMIQLNKFGGLPDSQESLKIGSNALLFERCKDENSLDWHTIKFDSDDDMDDQIHDYSDGDNDDQIDDHSDGDNDNQIDDHSHDDQRVRMISAIVRGMVKKANCAHGTAKEIIRDFKVDDKVDGMVNIEREISALQTTLCMIEGIVRVAEKKQIDNVYIQNWLRDLVDIGYEARDVLDDFITFSSCIITGFKPEEATNPVNFISSLMLSYFSGLSSDTSNIPLAILNRLEKDIKSARERFEEKKKEAMTFMILRSVVGGSSESVRTYRRHEVGPFINKQRDYLFLGREEVKQGIMEKILHHSDDNRVQVVAIWGMGGIGKTTLAQSIYNDERVKEDDYPTKNRRWLCVGENKFSAKEIITKIICYSSIDDIERLQKKLVEKLRGNRFLIVLDDVWDVDRNEWKILWDPLTNIRRGGVIILTTRRSEVITETHTLVPDALRPLSHEDSWSIFESCAFIDGNSDSRPDLKRIGEKIVEKLNGLPLALEVVGRSLLNESDAKIWRNFLESNEWKLNNNHDDIMSALKWSYNHLPSNLKQCFAYCALFPKDHVYDEKELVEMWMAHDLIGNIMGGGGQRRPEDIGAQYFKELVYASLIQLVDDEYVMHDMIHNLALLVSNGEFSCGNGLLLNDQKQKVRHITINLDDDYSTNLSLCTSKRILTLYTISSQQNFEENTSNFDKDVLLRVFEQLKSIRVLVLSHEEIIEIPDCISELTHLRYLDISQTSVESLPDSVCYLHNLQTLAAPHDAILPRKIVNMASLRHLRANITTYEGIAKLTSLQELSSVSVCEDGCISELGYLRELHGKLEIHGLENVTHPEDAAQVLMQDKIHIDELTLVFDVNLGNVAIATNVLDALQCPPNLTYLTIDGYSGNKCPNWMTGGMLAVNLQRLGLYKCHKLKLLPPLGELNSLKHLYLKSMHGIERLGVELYGKGMNGKVFFPSLISIYLYDMKNCKEWDSDFFKDTSVLFFPCLWSLTISKCPKLVSILPPLNAANVMRSLSMLDITDCPGLQLFKLDGLMCLQHLVIKNCSNLCCITPSLQVVSSIEKISISICKNLKRIDCESLPTLTDLSIIRCDEIVSIPHLVRIKRLDLNDCRKLKSLTIGRQGLVSLTDLDIEDCPRLESIYEEGSTSSSSSSSALELSKLQDIITDNKRIVTKLFNHELVSIASIFIDGFNGVECFGDIVQNKWSNLDKLVNLCISKCKDLKFLSPEFRDLPSLKVLHIYSCPKLESLPAGGLPDSLESLKIGSCPLLFERCKEDPCGPDWDKIKHISDKEILLHDSDNDNDDQIDDHSDGENDYQIDDYSDGDNDDQIDDHSDGDNDNQIDDHSHDDQRVRMISAIVREIVEKANCAHDTAKEIIKDFMVVDKVDGMVNIEREISALQRTLCMIEGIIHVAEKKQIDNVYLQNWLRDLVDLGYEARDVLDDFISFSSCIITGFKAEEATNPVNFISSLAILNLLEQDIRSVRKSFDKKKEGKTFATLKSLVGEITAS